MKVDSSSTRRWYQLHKSSWFILALVTIVLVAVNLPYEYARPGWMIGRSGGITRIVWMTGNGESETERLYGGWPLSYLSVRSGGYFDYPKHEWSTLALTGDLLVAVLLGALVVGAYEQRRRRRTRRWQLTLADLCFLMLFVSGIFGTWKMIVQHYRAQENAIVQLRIDGGESSKRIVLPKLIIGPARPSRFRDHFHTWLVAQLWNHERPDAARLTKFTDESMLALRQLAEIETLVVQNPAVTDNDVIATLVSLHDLERLQIDGAYLTDACVASLLRLKRLRYLRIRDAQLSDDAIAKLAALPRLISLDVEGTPLTDCGLAAIASHRRLRDLNIARTNVTEQGLQVLNGHPKLTQLWLASVQATAESPAVKRVQLSNLPELNSLHLPSQLDSLELTGMPSLTQLPTDWGWNDFWHRDMEFWFARFGTRLELQIAPYPQPMQFGITVKALSLRDMPSLRTLNLDRREIESLELDVASLQNLSMTRTHEFMEIRKTPARYVINDWLGELIGGNRSLQTLSLIDASLTPYGWAQLSSLRELQSLDLTGSNVTDEDLEAFSTANKLQKLSLANTQISNHGWDSLPRLARLQTLDLSGTQIRRLELEGLPELNKLSIANMPLDSLRLKDLPKLAIGLAVTSSAPLVVELENLSSLQEVYIREQCVERLEIENLPALGYLDLTGSSVDDSMFRDLGEWSALQVLLLGDTDITDTTLSRIGDLPHLDQLDLENTAITDDGLAAISPQRPLWLLNLTGTSISDNGLRHLNGQRSLDKLFLGRTNVRGPGLLNLSSMTSLQKLSLGETSVTSESLVHLVPLQQLKWLRLSDTKIDDTSFQHLARLAHLRELFLNGTSVTDQGLAEFKLPLPMKELDVTNTRVTAEGAKSVGARRAVKASW